MIFLSFAADFSLSQSLKHLFTYGTRDHFEALKEELKTHYTGYESRLYHNGRTALADAVHLLVPKKSKVVVNGLTCFAVTQAVRTAGCTPVYVDINDKDFNFDIRALKNTLEKDDSITAIIVQNHLGLPADIKTIEKLAKKHDLFIIEDLAHSAGSHYQDGREVGTVGSATALSFGKGKAIDTTEGGALIMRDATRHLPNPPQKLPKLSDLARDRIYPLLGCLIRGTYKIGLGKLIASLAFKTKIIKRSAEGRVQAHLRLANWQAKLALDQFKNLSSTAKKRAMYAERYGLPEYASILRIPFLVQGREALIKKLDSHHIYIDDSWYKVPVAPDRYYHLADFPEADCPTAVKVAGSIINLPLLPKTHLREAISIIEPEIIKHAK